MPFNWLSSAYRVLEESGAGKNIANYLKNEFEPAVGKYAQELMTKGTMVAGQHKVFNPDEAMTFATKVLKEKAFGKHGENIIRATRHIAQTDGQVRAGEFADVMDMYFKDSRAYWRDSVIKGKPSAGIAGVPISRAAGYKEPVKAIIAGKEITPETAIRRFGSGMFLPRIAIPHATQAPLNSLLVAGWKDTAKAFAEFAKDPQAARDLALRTGAMSQELMYEFKNQTNKRGRFMQILDPLRRAFNFERRWQIAFSAVVGKHLAIDAADEFIRTGSKRSELSLRLMGIDPALLKGKGLTQDLMDKASYRAVDEIMGLRSELDTPFKWHQSGLARIATIYKDYGFRQTRLIKNALVRAKQGEGWLGVAKVLGTIGTTWYAAGELIKAAESIVSLHNYWSDDDEKNYILGSEYLDGIAHASGLGITYSIVRSAKHNAISGYMLGPYLGSAADLAQDIINGNIYGAARGIGRKFGLPGTAATNIILPPRKKGKKAGDSGYGGYKAGGYKGY